MIEDLDTTFSFIFAEYDWPKSLLVFALGFLQRRSLI